MGLHSMGMRSKKSSQSSPDVLWRRGIWILLLAALFFKGKILYVLFYTLLLTYTLSQSLLNRGFNALQARRELSVERIFLGEEVDVKVKLENPTRIPLVWVLASDETTHQLNVTTAKRAVVSLGPRQRREWTYRVVGRQRGIHTLGPLHLEAGDAFGIAHLQGRAQILSPLVVYPRIHNIADLGLPSTLPFGDVQTAKRFFDDPAHTIGTREYQPGDPFKSVHWKVTARTGDLHVKEYQPTIAVDTVLFLNLNEPEYEVHLLDHYSELAIEVAASIGYDWVQKRQSVGLATNGSHPLEANEETMPGGIRAIEQTIYIPPRKGGGGLMQILDVLATVQCAPATPFVQLVSRMTPRLNWGATLILITPVDSPELLALVFSLRRSGFNVIIVVVGFAPIHTEYLHRPPAAGITLYHVRSPSELEAMGVAR